MTDELRMQGEVATPEPSADRGSGVARHVGQVSAATFLSRVLGLLRDQVFAAWFGAGTAADAFNMAFRVPNLLRDLFAEGAMSASFVPTFTQWREQQGDEAAWALGRQLMVTLKPLLWPYIVGSLVGAVVLATLAYPVALAFVTSRRRIHEMIHHHHHHP